MSDNTTPEPEPDGTAERERERREKLSRERLLLLADMDPTEFRRPSSPVFTEPAGDFSVRDELKPYEAPVRPDEEFLSRGGYQLPPGTEDRFSPDFLDRINKGRPDEEAT